MVEAVFTFVLVALFIVFIGVSIFIPIRMIWTDDILSESPQQKWHRRRQERKRARLDAKESGLPMYERIARSYERKAEKELAGDYPEGAFKYMNKAKEVREKAMQDMANGEFL